MSLTGRLLEVDGIRVFTHRTPRRAGHAPAGPPIVLVHGWMVGHWEWRHVVPRLEDAGHDVIAFDLPGFGESDRPSPKDYGYDGAAYQRTLVALLDALGIERAALVGHSLGGAIAVCAAARRPERVDRLVLVDPLIYPWRIPPEGQVLLVPYVGKRAFEALASKWVIRRFMHRWIYRDVGCASDEWVDYLWERLNRAGSFEAAHAALRFAARPAIVAESVRAVRAPSLIVWGEEDRLFPAAWARRLAGELVPGAEIVLVPACGHSPAEERPDALVEALLPFLGRRDPALQVVG